MSKNSYNSDIPPFAYAYIFKEALYSNLYVRQIEYWNKRLRKVSEKNVECYSREDSAFNTGDDRTFVALYYDGEVFNLLTEDNDQDYRSPYCLEVYQGDPELLDDMECLCTELRKLKKEQYVAERFLASLTIFEPPPKILHKILGDGLYRICHNALSDGTVNYIDMDWKVSEPEALKTFVNEQRPIITAMQERVLLNMITL